MRYCAIAFLVLGLASSAGATTVLSNNFDGGLGGFTTVDNDGTANWGLSGDAGNEADNWTGGTHLAASISSDVAGAGSYDDELISTVFSLNGFSSASMSFLVNYQAIGATPTADNFDVDISTDGGGSWTTLLDYANDTPVGGLRSAPGELSVIDLSAYAGLSNLTVRWHYYNPTDQAFDWYAQVDDVLVTGGNVIPEPGAALVFGVGSLVMGAGVRRRR